MESISLLAPLIEITNMEPHEGIQNPPGMVFDREGHRESAGLFSVTMRMGSFHLTLAPVQYAPLSQVNYTG